MSLLGTMLGGKIHVAMVEGKGSQLYEPTAQHLDFISLSHR